MAQINPQLYEEIALAYASIWTFLDGVAGQAREAVDQVVDVTSTGYIPYGETAADADAALEIELALLDVFNAAYISTTGIASSTSSLLDAVRAINNHCIQNWASTHDYANSTSATPDAKLTDWVNGGVNWTNACVPVGWKELSQDAGYQTSVWNTCIS